MKSYGEYCPIAMGAEVIGDRWTTLVLRELLLGSERFTDIHNGVPRMSRSLLSQRLKHMERIGIVERTEDGGYRPSPSGQDLFPVVWGIGEWAEKWLSGDPEKEHYDARHVMWRVRQRLNEEAFPQRRTVVQFDFKGVQRGHRIWLLLDREGSSVCERDEGFDVDLWVQADIGEFMRVWAGRTTWRDAMAAGKLELDGPRPLVRAFPDWFLLSPFAAA